MYPFLYDSPFYETMNRDLIVV